MGKGSKWGIGGSWGGEKRGEVISKFFYESS